MPHRRRAKLPLLLRMRNFLLLGVLGFVAALVALYLFGRAGLHDTDPAPDGSLVAATEGVSQVSSDFDYTQYQDDQAIFRVQGDRYTMDRNNVANLEGVDITVFRPSGDYHATSETAIYRQDGGSAQLDGDVHLEGPDALKLRSEQLLVSPAGQRVASPVPVDIEYGPVLVGNADRMQVEVASELYLLHGNVSLRTRPDAAGPPSELQANRAFLERIQRLLRAEGKVSLQHGENSLYCQRLSAYLSEGAARPEFIRALWGVRGKIQVRRPNPQDPRGIDGNGGSGVGGSTEPLLYFAENAVVLFNASGTEIRKVELEGSANRTAILHSIDPVTGNLRRVTANYMVGDFTQNGLEKVQVFGQVRIVELPDGKPEGTPLRQARSERAEGHFRNDGVFDAVTLIRNVDYRDADVRLTAQRGEVQLDTGVGVFTGGSDGKSPARLISERGEMTAQKIRYRKQQDSVLAEGGVRSQFQPAAGGGGEPLPSTLLGKGEGPVWVESDSVQWNRADNTSYFRGKVRAWRDRNLLQAEELRAVPGEERLIASGGVKTVWFPQRPPVEKDTAPPIGPGQRRGVVPTPAPQALEVTAGSLDYLGKVGQVRYTDAVRIVDGPRRMECSEAEVKLAEDGGMESLLCLGNARLDDRAEGKVVMGERAVYDPVAKTIEVRGNPVTLKDRDGTQVEGRRVIYDLESGNARFLAAPAPAALNDPVLRVPEEDTP